MHFRIEQRYAADVDAVEAAYCSAELLQQMANLPKVGGAELVDQRLDGDHVFQRVRYRFTGDLNAAVTAVVDASKLSWVEESDIDRARHVTQWRIEPDHYASRLSCEGTFHLVGEPDGGTVRVTEADIRVHFPLVGGKVEKAIVSGLREHAAGEQAVVAAYLQGR